MCGICGIVGPRRITEADIKPMADRLAHRGPDDAGIHLEEGIGFGHRRLSIIDLDGGHQPMANEDETVWITFNGEIYNYQELREQLLRRGHRFETDSDTETIVHLYEEKGEKCVESLRGMFAFAIWDSRAKRLLLARDHLGQKPLYYAIRDESIFFASEIKALLCCNEITAKVNCEALKEYLTLRVIAGTHSMFSGIVKLNPGHTLTFENGRATTRQYWDLSHLPKEHLNEEEAIEAIDEQLRETIRLHLVSDVEVGAFLSGGLDSSLIVALMNQSAVQPIKTFSVGIPYKGFSELPYANAVNDICRTEPFQQDMAPTVKPLLPKVIWHLDEPSDPLAACMFFISEMVRRQVKVVMGGDGGDELFAGYDRYFGNKYVGYYGLLPAAIRAHVLRRVIERIPDGFWYKSLSQRLRWVNEMSFLEGGSRYARSLSYFYFPPHRIKGLCGPVLEREVGDVDGEESVRYYFDRANADDLIDRMLYADYKVRLPNHSVMILDRATMAYGLEARSPFLDHRLTEFAARLPASLKLKGRSLRYIQGRLGLRYLPRRVIYRKKQGFSSALPYLLEGEFRVLFQRFLRRSHLVEAGYLNGATMQHFVDEHLDRKVDHGNRLWLLLNSELWYRMHIEGIGLDQFTAEFHEGGSVVGSAGS